MSTRLAVQQEEVQSLGILRRQVAADGSGGYIYYNDGAQSVNGVAGTSYGNGGAGGTRGSAYTYYDADDKHAAFNGTPTAGANGWVYIEYGGDI